MASSRLAAFALAGLAALSSAVPAAAQTVEGRMVEAGSGEAVAGASVLLLDVAGERVDFALTDADGRFRLEAAAPGRFRIAFERIGYEGSESGAFDLAAGEVARRRLEVPVRPLALPTIEAVTERRCRVRPVEGEVASMIWEEVRKALEANVWTERRRALRYTLVAWERRLEPGSMEVLEERTRRREGATRASPWVAEDPERLVREGFVREEGDEIVYNGLDASTILSEAFLDAHCFRAVPAPVENPGWIGLAFEPQRGTDGVGVRGVLWVDRETSELRRLDFGYVDLPPELRFDVVEGRVEFERVPTGEWIVERWWIRMPIVGVSRRTVAAGMRMDASRNRPRLLAVEEDGGEVVETRTTRRGTPSGGEVVRVVWSEPIDVAPAEEPRGPGAADGIVLGRGVAGPGTGLRVVVVDRRTGAPLADADVLFPEASAGGRTDAAGRVDVTGVAPGRQRLRVGREGYESAEGTIATPARGWRVVHASLAPEPSPSRPPAGRAAAADALPVGGGLAVPPGVVVEAVDATTREPVDGVQVAVRGTGRGGTAGADGRVVLGPFPPGPRTIDLERLGYVPFEAEVEVPREGFRRYRVEIHPMPILAEALEATIEPDRIERAIGEARYRLTAEEIPDHTPLSVPELIAYRLPGLHYNRTTGWESLRERGGDALGQVCPSFTTRNGQVELFIVDGVRYKDACVLETLVPGEIAEIAVIVSYAGQLEFGKSGGGVVIIRTTRGPDDDE